MTKEKTFQTLDLYLASYLAFYGIHPSLENVTGKIIFVFPQSDALYRVIEGFNADKPVPCNSFVTTIKMLRGQMLSLRGRQGMAAKTATERERGGGSPAQK